MRKTFLLGSLFDEFFNSSLDWEVKGFPEEGDSNFNKTVEEFENDTHVIKNETWKSLDGSQTFKRQVVESKSKTLDIEGLRLEMKKAIEKEDFEKAAMIRDRIRSMNGQKLLTNKKGEK